MSRTGFKERWPLFCIWGLVVVLFAIPIMLGRWAWQPLVMIVFGIVATQIGAIFRQKLVKNLFGEFALREHLNRQGTEPDQIGEADKTKLVEFKSAVETRISPPNKVAQDALDSYLNQAVGTLSMVILCFGIVFALVFRALLGIPGPSWIIPLLVVVAMLVMAWLIWYVLGKFNDPNSLIIYYGHKKLAPPSGAATVSRVIVLILYCCLVFAASWPIRTCSLREARG